MNCCTFGGRGSVMIEATSDLQLVDEVTMKLKFVIHRCKYPPALGVRRKVSPLGSF